MSCFKTGFSPIVFICAPTSLQVYSAKTEENCGQPLSCIILAAQVLYLGLWNA